MDRGFVKMWRKLKDSDLMQNHNALALWIWMLINANYKARSFCSKGLRVDLCKGQLLYGRAKVSKLLGLTESKTRTALAYLIKTSRVTSKTTNKGTILTIVNWGLYQSRGDDKQPIEQPTGDQQLTSGQPAGDHSEEVKNTKKLKNKNSLAKERDEIWDSVCAVFHLNPQTKSECSRIGKIVRDLKTKEATPAEIERRSSCCKKEWSDAACTPEALTKHWDRYPQDWKHCTKDNGQIPKYQERKKSREFQEPYSEMPLG